MNRSTITKFIEEMNNLPDDLQQQVLKFVTTLRQQPSQIFGNAWDVLESLTESVETPADWSAEHDHYLTAHSNVRKPIHDERSAD